MSLTPPKEEDEEDIDFLYRVGAARWLYQNDRGREDSRSSTEKEYVDELLSGTANGENSTANRDNDL